jgi:hypothetical protein
MVQVGNAATLKQKEVKRKYPVTSGLVAGTTKQEGRKPFLKARKKFISKREQVGIY